MSIKLLNGHMYAEQCGQANEYARDSADNGGAR